MQLSSKKKGAFYEHKRAVHEGDKYHLTIKQQQKEILLDIKGRHIKKLDSHEGIVINNILLGQILQININIFDISA